MAQDPTAFDTETLAQILTGDQRSENDREAEREHDRAIAKCSTVTAGHYTTLKGQGLPAHLLDRLTLDFQEQYLGALLAPAYSFLSADMEDE